MSATLYLCTTLAPGFDLEIEIGYRDETLFVEHFYSDRDAHVVNIETENLHAFLANLPGVEEFMEEEDEQSIRRATAEAALDRAISGYESDVFWGRGR